MKPEKGQYVKCLLTGGPLVEGIVEEWSNYVRLKSNNDYYIIHNIKDIILTKIINQVSEIPLETLEKEFQETYEKPSDDHLRVKQLTDLRVLMAQQEKKIIEDQLKSHTISGAKPVKYESIYGFHKKQIIK